MSARGAPPSSSSSSSSPSSSSSSPSSSSSSSSPPAPAFSVGDRAVAIDAGAIVGLSVAICVGAQHLAPMSIVVPSIIVARFALLARVPATDRALAVSAEVGLFALCAVVGGFNDWNSVTHHHVYDYRVPVERASLSTIPVWMLLAWGLILRFLATLFRWRRLGLPPPARGLWLGGRRWGGPPARLALMLGLVLVTRQTVYRTFDDPLWSWLPFAVAIVVAVVLLRPDRRRLAVLAGFVVIGPLIEILYIQIGGLHRYHLGWLGGVPLWIVLWWGLAGLVWDEISDRLITRARRRTAAPAIAGRPSRVLGGGWSRRSAG